MSYSLLTYPELMAEVILIRDTNRNTLDRNAQLVESTVELIKGTDVEYFLQKFDSYRHFFNQVENFFDDILFDLDQQKITLGLVDRIRRFGTEAQTQLESFKPQVDKRELNSAIELKGTLNEWYELIANNLITISNLQFIADALNNNFRHITPFNEVGLSDIAEQSSNGITLTKTDEVYIDGRGIKLEGQRNKMLIYLIKRYFVNPNMPVSWMEIEPEIRETEVPMEKDVVVNRVSSLRTRLTELGFDKSVIEIEIVTRGIDASWKLVKH